MKKKRIGAPVPIRALAKLWKIMRLSVFFLLLFVAQTFATVTYSQQTRLTLKMQGAKVIDVLGKIEDESQFYFLFNQKLVDVERRVDVDAKNESVEKILNGIFGNTNVSYLVKDRQIVLTTADLNFSANQQQQKSVSGKVTDSTGSPLPGVSVVVKGTTTGNITDANGNYSLSNIPENATLQFSFVGMKGQEIAVGGKTVINVTLAEDAIGIEEVVAIGYGTMKKSDLTGSVTQVKAEELERVTISSVQQALQGRAAGVQVSQGSSMPGGGISIRVRGSNSIQSNNEPLYIVDGFPIMANSSAIPSGDKSNSVSENPLASLNPSDIESLEILKDASATAIYGSRGANGVILITTKRGKEGQSDVQFEASYGIQQVTRLYDVMNAKQFIRAANEYAIGQQTNLPFPDNKPVAPYSPDTDTDWQKEIYRIAPVKQYQITAQGGDKLTRYSLSAGYFNQEGVVKNSGFERFSLRINGDKRIGKKLEVSNSLLVSRIYNDRVPTEGDNNQNAGPTNSALLYRPTLPVFNPDGSYTQAGRDGSIELINSQLENPVAALNEIDNLMTKDDILGNLSIQFEPVDGLFLKSSLGTSISHSRRDLYASRLSNRGGRGSNGLAIISRANIQSFLNENTITYIKDFGLHRINLLGGFTLQKEIGMRDQMSNTQFPNDITKQNDIGAGTQEGGPNISSTKWNWSMASYLTRLNYVYRNRYLATFTFRADGSSKFGKGNKWASFPSAAIAWRMNEEDFIRNLDFFSNLKLRTSWGVTGNSEIGSYQSLSRFGLTTYSFNNWEESAFYPNSIANPNLKWETTTQYDIGIDIGFMDNRVAVEADYYQKFTEDGLMGVTLPYNSGFNTATMNLAKVENKGLELTFRAEPFIGDFKWDIAVNYSRNRNEVTDLSGIGPIYGANVSSDFKWANATVVQEGHPMGMFYGFRIGGVFEDDNDIQMWQNGLQVGTASPGDYKYFDVIEDGKLNNDDREFIGNPHPDFIAGITNNFSYKNFDLSVFIQGAYGNDVLNVNKWQLYGGGFETNKAVEWYEKRWTPDNTKAEWPRFGRNNPVGSNIESWAIEDGSFLRLKSLVLGYNIPPGKINWIRRARIQLSGDNLLLLTKYSGYDPDVNTMMGGGSNYTLGIDNGAYPSARVFKLGVSINF